MKKSRFWLVLALLVPLGTTFLGITIDQLGGTNPYTPPGHEGYVSHQPLMMGHRGFVGTQTGPASTGWQWRQFVTNIDMRPQNYSESMQIFSRDNLEVSFEAHARIQLVDGSVQDVIERYSGDTWYTNNVQRPYRTAVREIVRQHDAFEIKNRSEDLGREIQERLTGEYEGTPFEFISVSIGNINYPQRVEAQVVANLAAEQRRQRMGVQREIAEAQARIREIRAGGEAEAQHIEQATLTPLYVQHEAAELYSALADETNDDDGTANADVIVVVPTHAGRAGVPRIYTGR